MKCKSGCFGVVVIIVSVALGVMLSSCCPQRLLNTSTVDSTRVEIVERRVEIRDTVVVEIATERDSAQVAVDSLSVLENSVAISRAQTTMGVLHHWLETKPVVIEKQIVAEVVVRDSVVYRDRATTNVVEVERDLTWWQRAQIKGFWIVLALLGVAFGVFKV